MAERKFTVTTGAATSAVLVAVLVVSIIGAAGTNGAAQPSIDGNQIQSAGDAPTADEIYVKDNGDAVLVYQADEESGDTDLQQMELGMSVSEGLAHVLIKGDSEELEDNASGGLTLLLERNRFTGNGTFGMDKPEDLDSLTLDVMAERTSETNTFDADFSASAPLDGQAAQAQSMQTSGSMSMSADTFTTSGTFSAETALPVEESYDVSASGTETGYSLSVSQTQPVSEYQADRWNSRTAAKQTLESQFGGVAESFGGTSTVTIESYSFEQSAGTTSTLDISYTIEYSGVKDGVAAALESQLANDPSLDMSSEEASAVAQSVVDVELRTLDANLDASAGTVEGGWEVEIGNYAQALRSGLDIAEQQSTDENVTEAIGQINTMLDAQQAADLRQTVEWSGSLTTTDSTVEMQANVSSDSENWAAYVDELQANGVDAAQNDVSMELHAQTEDGRLTADMSMSVEQEDLVGTMVDSIMQSAAQSPTGSEQSQRILRQLKNSQFQTGKIDVSVDSENVVIEAGAKFDNMSALGQQINEAYGGHTVTQVAGTLADSESNAMHVHVDSLVAADAGESDVSALAVADSETEINMAGDWDRSFSTMDTERAKQFLGLSDSESDEEGSDSSLPGFGPAVAVLALVGAALIARRRN
ncbi:MYXO-CTERM domain-containing protein/PGF-CTERM protein [Natronoarchaeum philippinense]|uniref:MYXO-CTERM domain-containing protein/PGF-CTERM protein n=1 Tax=Natronoarchaeum philippinense TaxID=558529 RepID=A0A285NDN3_NATPI|nr:PGF-CTERM sorting domain-containing protein [Natronoarchaeum philippinense]SNZ07003.1 MYXO-CTERM domain-containing protein/PGF-CTERM protein [Natronoarchaeum philippinense]